MKSLAAVPFAVLLTASGALAQDTTKLTDSSVPATSSVADGDFLLVVQGGVSKRGTAGQVRSAVTSFAADPANCSAGEAAAGISALGVAQSCFQPAPYGRYDPHRTPATLHACSDGFIGGFEATWTWQNQATATDAVDHDSAVLEDRTGAGGNSRRVRWLTCTEPTDSFTTTVKLYTYAQGTSNSAGIALLLTGTEASPTSIATCDAFTTTPGLRAGTLTSYTAAISQAGSTKSIFWGAAAVMNTPVFLQARYDDTADTIGCYTSYDGISWEQVGTNIAATSDPLAIGRFVNPTNPHSSRWYFFRTRTDADRNDAGD